MNCRGSNRNAEYQLSLIELKYFFAVFPYFFYYMQFFVNAEHLSMQFQITIEMLVNVVCAR